jgi:predicted nucleic acid-binding protein
VSERWVVNASPLIALGRIGRLDLLAALADEVVIPEDVVSEVERGPSVDQTMRARTFALRRFA